MQETTQQQPSYPTVTPTVKSPSILPFFLLALCMAAAGVAGFFYFQNTQLQQQVTELTTTLSLEPQVTPDVTLSPDSSQQWRLVDITGYAYSYEYPRDWHVAELWPDTQGGPRLLVMDPDPINTAPGDTALGDITFAIYNGLPNPAEFYEEQKGSYNETNYSNIKTETLQSNVGSIYYFTGIDKTEINFGTQVERYMFMFNTESDPANQYVVVAYGNVDDKKPELPELLRHVVMSFKDKQ